MDRDARPVGLRQRDAVAVDGRGLAENRRQHDGDRRDRVIPGIVDGLPEADLVADLEIGQGDVSPSLVIVVWSVTVIVRDQPSTVSRETDEPLIAVIVILPAANPPCRPAMPANPSPSPSPRSSGRNSRPPPVVPFGWAVASGFGAVEGSGEAAIAMAVPPTRTSAAPAIVATRQRGARGARGRRGDPAAGTPSSVVKAWTSVLAAPVGGGRSTASAQIVSPISEGVLRTRALDGCPCRQRRTSATRIGLTPTVGAAAAT